MKRKNDFISIHMSDNNYIYHDEDTTAMNIIDSIESPVKHQYDPSHNSSGTNLPHTKRKLYSLNDETSLSEQIKRFRITNTPGELR